MVSLRQFYGYTEADLDPNIPDGTYLLTARDYEIGEWDDGRPRADIMTQVVEGDCEGKFGPRINWTLGEFEGENFTVTADESQKRMLAQAEAMKGGEVTVSRADLDPEQVLAEVAKQVKGSQFIAIVTRDNNGYPRARRIFSTSNPPKSYKGAVGRKKFSVEEV